MTNFTYNQTIEYIDGTRDLNFEEAQKWAKEHGTSFEEDVTARKMFGDKLMRFFVIGNEPKPYIPTEDELKAQIRSVRNWYLQQTDKFMLVDYPISDEERELYKQYRVYLRTYPECRDWYKANPKTYEEWYALYLEADKLQTELTVAHQPTEVQDEQS